MLSTDRRKHLHADSADERTERAIREGLHTVTGDFDPGSPAWNELIARLIPFKGNDANPNRVLLNIAVVKVAVHMDSLLAIKCPIKKANRVGWTASQTARCQMDISSGDFTANDLTDLRLLVSIRNSP